MRFAAGAWPELPAIYARRLNEAHMRPLKLILLAHRPPAEDEARKSHAAVRAALRVPSLKARLIAARLRYAGRAAATGPPFVVALLRSKVRTAWREAVVRDTKLLRLALPLKLGGLPNLRVDIVQWEALWKSGQGKGRPS